MSQEVAKPDEQQYDPYAEGDQDSEPTKAFVTYLNFGGSGKEGFWNAREEEEYDSLTGIALLSRTRRRYYADEYVGGAERNDPTCESDDGLTGTKFGDCSECHLSSFSGGPPECGEYRRLLIWHTETGSPDGTQNLSILTVPPASIGPWERYRSRLRMSGGRDYTTVTLFTRVKAILRNKRENWQLHLEEASEDARLPKDSPEVAEIIRWRPVLQELMTQDRAAVTEPLEDAEEAGEGEQATLPTPAPAAEPKPDTPGQEAVTKAAAAAKKKQAEKADAAMQEPIGIERSAELLLQLGRLGLDLRQILAVYEEVLGPETKVEDGTRAQGKEIWEKAIKVGPATDEQIEKALLG